MRRLLILLSVVGAMAITAASAQAYSISVSHLTVAPGSVGAPVYADCPPGTTLTGGGYLNPYFELQVGQSFPTRDPYDGLWSWRVQERNPTNSTATFYVYAVCI
jgi:hypothetical protein